MKRAFFIPCIVSAIGILLVYTSMIGCAARPSRQELSKLDMQRSAAEAAESKLAALKTERLSLEATLSAKEEELKKQEAERDQLRQNSRK